MSLFSGAKNNKYYYPPIVKIRKNNVYLSDLNNLKSIKNKKNNNIRSLNQNFHINKSNSYTNVVNVNKKNEFLKEQDNSLLLNLKNRFNSKNEKYNKYVDNEALYEKNIQLKTEINQIKKDLQQMKAENQRKEKEIIKRDKLLITAFDKQIKDETDLESLFIIEDKKNNENINLEKNIKKNNYMTKFRKQYNELKKKYEEKIGEVNALKKNIKISKLNEMTIQYKETLKEMHKLKELYVNLFQENKKNLEKLKKLNVYESELNDKNLLILQLQESLKISSASNIKYENELEELRETINNLQVDNKNLLEKLKKLYESYNKLSSRKKGNENNFLGFFDVKRRSDISFNNTNRNFLNLANKINTDIRSKHLRNSVNPYLNRKISPLSKKIPNSSINSNIKKNNNNEISNSANIIKKEEINISNIKEDENKEKKENKEINEDKENKENKDNKEDNIKNVNENENEEDNNIFENIETMREINEDITQSSYMLIKNFEACKITKEDSLTVIIKPILNEISSEKQIKNDILVNLFTNKISECINCTKNENDIISINSVINTLLNDSKYELFAFIKNFLYMFDSVKVYTDNISDEENIIKKINLSLSQYKEYFEISYTNKFISFSVFRGLLNNKNIILDDESIEYLIYRMKKDCPNIISLNEEKNKNNNKENNINNENEKEKNKENEKNDEINKNKENIINKDNEKNELNKEKENNIKDEKKDDINKDNKDKDVKDDKNKDDKDKDDNKDDKNGGVKNIQENNIVKKEDKNLQINGDKNNTNNIIISLNTEKPNNVKKNEEIPIKIVNISQEEENSKKENKVEDKNENKKEEKIEGVVIDTIIDTNENCSIFDLNYITFLNLI